MNKFKCNKGSAILVTLALMLIISLVAISAVDQATTEVDISYNQLHKEKAFYIAEAGLKRALAEISANPYWDSGFVNVKYEEGLFSVTYIDSNTNPSLVDTIIIRSESSYKNSHGGVETWLVPLPFNPFKYAMYGDDIIDIRNSMYTDSYNSDSGTYIGTALNEDGSIGSNGDVLVKNGAIVGGDAVTSLDGGLVINPGSTVLGDTTSTAPAHDLELVPQSEYDWAEATSIASTGITGDYTYNPGTKAFTADNGNVVLSGGIYYFSSIILDQDAAITIPAGEEVTIYVTGDMEIKNSGDINAGGTASDLVFYSQGDLVLKNSGTLTGVFYCPEGSADLRNSSDFYGSIIASDIVAHNSAGFHYDRELDKYRRKSQKYKDPIAWREVDF
ncbi:PilX N-terminal domain-containing pilus assembly protein [Candidatus Zixiibacteriota bacterium]